MQLSRKLSPGSLRFNSQNLLCLKALGGCPKVVFQTPLNGKSMLVMLPLPAAIGTPSVMLMMLLASPCGPPNDAHDAGSDLQHQKHQHQH